MLSIIHLFNFHKIKPTGLRRCTATGTSSSQTPPSMCPYTPCPPRAPLRWGIIVQHREHVTAVRPGRIATWSSVPFKISPGPAQIRSAARARPPCPNPCSLVKVVLFGEIEVNPSDVKHATEVGAGCRCGYYCSYSLGT